jgi:putative SOS response-associated peptidase YedK
MCGRFTLRTPADAWCQMFLPELELPAPPADPPRYNIAPTQRIWCVLRERVGSPATVAKLRWGLVPSWADDIRIGNRMINARAETVDQKPAFKRAFAQRRALIIADGYYEWQRTADRKQPFLIERSNQTVFAFAGLWEENRHVNDDGSALRTCTVLTTNANQTTRMVHDRMPVILRSEDYTNWIDPAFRDTMHLKSLLVPWEGHPLQLTPVSSHVNNPRHDDPSCVIPDRQF